MLFLSVRPNLFLVRIATGKNLIFLSSVTLFYVDLWTLDLDFLPFQHLHRPRVARE